MTTFPGDDEYRQRKVQIVVDGEILYEQLCWSDSSLEAGYLVCKPARSILREHVRRARNKQRYSNGHQKKLDDRGGTPAS